MALGVTIAGNALAADATRVIYDLSSLRASPAATTAPGAQIEVQLPSHSLPIASPSLHVRGASEEAWDSGYFANPKRTHGWWRGRSSGQPAPGRGLLPGQTAPGGDPSRDPSPTPEPGSMLLLGGALASGIRFMRRR
jgi:hypothetical protein